MAAVREIRRLIATGGSSAALPARDGAELGMSFEVTGVEVVDKRARIWTLSGVTFTGAAILRRDKAAFADTWIELVSS